MQESSKIAISKTQNTFLFLPKCANGKIFAAFFTSENPVFSVQLFLNMSMCNIGIVNAENFSQRTPDSLELSRIAICHVVESNTKITNRLSYPYVDTCQSKKGSEGIRKEN